MPDNIKAPANLNRSKENLIETNELWRYTHKKEKLNANKILNSAPVFILIAVFLATLFGATITEWNRK